jgi:hypothetical protein
MRAAGEGLAGHGTGQVGSEVLGAGAQLQEPSRRQGRRQRHLGDAVAVSMQTVDELSQLEIPLVHQRALRGCE